MRRKVKQSIKINNTNSLEGLCQEIYNDSCLQIMDAQKAINELSTSTKPEDVDDHTKIAREKANLLKIKDSGIGKKLEIAKLQITLLKNVNNEDEPFETGFATPDDFKSVREMLKANKESEIQFD